MDGEECRVKTARDTGLKWLVYSSTGLRVPIALWHIMYSVVLQRYGEVNTPTSELITSHMQAMIQISSTFDLVFCRRSEPMR